MVRARSLGCDHDRAPSAMKAVADQSLPLEISLTWPPAVWEDKRGLPFVIFRARLVRAGLIQFRRRVVIRRLSILEAGQTTILVNSNGVPEAVFAETLGSRYVFLPAYRFHRDPESPVVHPMSNSREVVRGLP